jgi:hypothetical protein
MDSALALVLKLVPKKVLVLAQQLWGQLLVRQQELDLQSVEQQSEQG